MYLLSVGIIQWEYFSCISLQLEIRQQWTKNASLHPGSRVLHSTLGSRLPFFIEGRRWNEPQQTARQAERLSEVDPVSPYLYDKRATNFLLWCDSWQLSSIVVGRDKSFSHGVQFYSIFHETLYCCTSKKMIWELRPWQVSVSSMPTCQVNF